MSNFSKEELYELYDKYLPSFTELAEKAHDNGIYLEVDIDPDGDITFMSREYFAKNNKECVRVHKISQGKNHVSEESRTQALRVLDNDAKS